MGSDDKANDGRFIPSHEYRVFLQPAVLNPFSRFFNRLSAAAKSDHRAYNNPDHRPNNEAELYNLATSCNLPHIAREIAREWGSPNEDAALYGFNALKNWPRDTLRGAVSLRLTFGQISAKHKILDLIPLGATDMVSIHDHNDRLVLSSAADYIRPGDWMTHLMLEYARLRQWRKDNETTHTPAPLCPLPRFLAVA